MTTSSGLDGVARVIGGVDTHLDEHVAVAIDHHGTRLGEYRLGTTAKGYEDLETWAIGLGQVATFGVEGTGSYGAGLARTPCSVWPQSYRGQPTRQVHTP